MHMNQRPVFPRWSGWEPLATQQFRLRNLTQILAMNVGREDLEGKIRTKETSNESYYYTLHTTALSAPFYTSEKIQSSFPKWRIIDSSVWSQSVLFGGMQALVIRLWCHITDSGCDEVIITAGVHLSGLLLLGQQIGPNVSELKENSLILLLPGGYYSIPSNVKQSQNRRYTSIAVQNEDVRCSYSFTMLSKLNSLQMAINDRTSQSEVLKQQISSGDYLKQCNRSNAMLRRFLNKTRSNHSEIAKIKESLEIARFRVRLLSEERTRMSASIKKLNEYVDKLADSNEVMESRTMENYRLLHREVHSHREWQILHVERREAQLHSRALLNFRVKQLISEICLIYPVENISENKFTICGVHLPDSENFAGKEDLKISVALGFVAHVVQLISVFLQVPTRYSIVLMGSRSRIVDDIADKIPDAEREFPLFCKGKDRLQFNYAVYLLNKNIAQLRHYCGLGTYDLRCTLANLSSLLRLGAPDARHEGSMRSPSSSILDLASSLESNPVCLKSAFPATFDHFLSNRNVAGSSERGNTGPSRPRFGTDTSHLPVSQVSTLGNNLSYSLDKGLNEFQEICKISKNSGEPSFTGPSLLGGSESSLAFFTNASDSQEAEAKKESKSEFLRAWEQEKKATAYSDSDSEPIRLGLFVDKTTECQQAADYGSIEIVIGHQIDESAVEPMDSHSDGPSSSTILEECAQDALLESVSNRTEALASQTSTFNMFRSRFRNTLGTN